MQVVEQAQTQLTSPRINQDPRIKTAYDIYNSFEYDQILIYKTTRAGCTTALVAESMNRKEQVLVIVPTNHIADKTIIKDAKKYSDDKPHADIIHIPSNHKCVLNEELVEQFPDLAKLPILPLADKCTECQHFNTCEVTAIMRGEGRDGIVLTYDKLAALMMAMSTRPNTMAEDIINTISKCKNAVFDEIHEMQYGKSISLTVYNDKLKDKYIDLNKYLPVASDFKYIISVVLQFKQLLEDTQTKIAIFQAYQGAESEDYWKHKLSITIDNKFSKIDFLTECSETKAIMGVYAEIIELTKVREQYGLEMKDITIVYDMLRIILNDRVVVHSIRDAGDIKVNFVSVDNIYTSMLRSFTMSIQDKCNRIMLTSATICSHEYGNYFMQGEEPKKVRFGPGGDPMSTNSMMLILADRKKYGAIGRNSIHNKLEEIAQRVCTILEAYGSDNCIIITMNIREAMQLKEYLKTIGHEHHVTYYKAPEMMGVSADARVMIAVGVADKPSNAFDAITKDKSSSLVLREEAMHCDTWQAWSRIKDPQGKDPSIVFALGCSDDKCKNIVSWGIDRNVIINEYENGHRKQVDIRIGGGTMTFPSIIKCNGFDEMLKVGNNHKTFKKDLRQIKDNASICHKAPINYIIGTNWQKVAFVYNVTKLDLLNKFLINRYDTFAEQTRDGRYFRVSNQISETLLNNHIDDKITIGSYSTSLNGSCKWICFDIDAHKKDTDSIEEVIEKENKAEEDLINLTTFLKSVNINNLVESSGSPHSYHIWIFIQEVEVAKAYYVANLIAKESGFDGEVNPKQRTWNTHNQYGNLVKLPFAFHKKHGTNSFIHGWDKETMEISVYDISDVEVVSTRKKRANNSVHIDVKLKGVRPCIQAALEKDLYGEQGNKMRVAIVREFWNSGMTDKTALTELFKNQSDYDFDKSMYYVEKITEQEFKVWPRETLLEKCPIFIECETCERYDCKGGN